MIQKPIQMSGQNVKRTCVNSECIQVNNMMEDGKRRVHIKGG